MQYFWRALQTYRSIKSAIFRTNAELWCCKKNTTFTITMLQHTNRLRDIMKFRAIFQTLEQCKWNAFALVECTEISSRVQFDFLYIFTFKK